MNPHLETLLRKSKEQKKPLKKKQKMIYTSTPFRGLHLVPTIFKNVNKYTDGYTMDVYSSLKTYFMDDKQYPDLAKTLKEIDETDGINNNGAIPQKELSQKYLESRIMMYPNIFKETSCVSAIEALSSGNIVVTSDKGALPETCCGFGCHFKLDFMTEFSYEVPNHFVAKLPNIGDFDKSQLGSYTRRVIDVIKNYNNKYVKQIKEQIEFCLENYTYEARANNFLLFLRGSKHETPQRFKQLIETNKILDAINFYEHGYMFAEVNNDTHELYRNTIEKLKFNHFENVHEYSMKKQIMQLYLKDDYSRIIQFFKVYFDKEHLLPKFSEFFQKTTSKFMELLDKERFGNTELNVVYEKIMNKNRDFINVDNLIKRYRKLDEEHDINRKLQLLPIMLTQQPDNMTYASNAVFHNTLLGNKDEVLYYGNYLIDNCYPTLSEYNLFQAVFNSNLIFLKYSEYPEGKRLLKRALEFVKHMNNKPRPTIQHTLQNRPLRRIGYVTDAPHFHPVGQLIHTLCKHHKHDDVRVYVVSDENPLHLHPEVAKLQSEKFKSNITFYKLNPKDPLDIVRQIKAHEIDVLIEMMGYTQHSKVELMMHKPAPIIISYFAYPHTLNIKEIDYMITDKYLTAVKSDIIDDDIHMNKLELELLHPFEKIGAFNDYDEKIYNKDEFVIGTCNNICKITDTNIEMWAKAMKQCPNMKFHLYYKLIGNPQIKQRYYERFAKYGIEQDRIILDEHKGPSNMCDAYQQIHLALDPYPYNGGWTSAECLWFKTPYITREGSNYVSRVGGSLLTQVGLEDFICKTKEDYINKIVYWYNHQEELKQLSKTIREQFQNSLMCKPAEWMVGYEKALNKVWNDKVKTSVRKVVFDESQNKIETIPNIDKKMKSYVKQNNSINQMEIVMPEGF